MINRYVYEESIARRHQELTRYFDEIPEIHLSQDDVLSKAVELDKLEMLELMAGYTEFFDYNDYQKALELSMKKKRFKCLKILVLTDDYRKLSPFVFTLEMELTDIFILFAKYGSRLDFERLRDLYPVEFACIDENFLKIALKSKNHETFKLFCEIFPNKSRKMKEQCLMSALRKDDVNLLFLIEHDAVEREMVKQYLKHCIETFNRPAVLCLLAYIKKPVKVSIHLFIKLLLAHQYKMIEELIPHPALILDAVTQKDVAIWQLHEQRNKEYLITQIDSQWLSDFKSLESLTTLVEKQILLLSNDVDRQSAPIVALYKMLEDRVSDLIYSLMPTLFYKVEQYFPDDVTYIYSSASLSKNTRDSLRDRSIENESYAYEKHFKSFIEPYLTLREVKAIDWVVQVSEEYKQSQILPLVIQYKRTISKSQVFRLDSPPTYRSSVMSEADAALSTDVIQADDDDDNEKTCGSPVSEVIEACEGDQNPNNFDHEDVNLLMASYQKLSLQ